MQQNGLCRLADTAEQWYFLCLAKSNDLSFLQNRKRHSQQQCYSIGGDGFRPVYTDRWQESMLTGDKSWWNRPALVWTTMYQHVFLGPNTVVNNNVSTCFLGPQTGVNYPDSIGFPWPQHCCVNRNNPVKRYPTTGQSGEGEGRIAVQLDTTKDTFLSLLTELQRTNFCR